MGAAVTQRLSAHVQEWTPGALEFCLRLGGPFVKTMSPTVEPIAKILEAHPKTQVIVRKYYSLEEQAELLKRGAIGGIQVADDVAHMFKDIEHLCVDREAPLWFEGLNETGLWNDAANYNAFTVAFAARCNEWMVNPLAYSFPVGNPPIFEHWNAYIDGLRACMKYGGGLALHQYGWPDVRHDADWLSCRHRKVREVLPDDLKNIPIIVTECGLDKGVAGGVPPGVRPEDGAGWTNAGIDPDQYAEQLVWLDREYDRDNVIAGTIFTVGGFWPSFDVVHVPKIADVIHNAASVPQEVPVPIETVFQVQTPSEGATVIAGQMITVNGRVLGVAGQGMLTATLAEDTRPGTPQYGEPTNVRGVPIAADGWFSFSMQVPNSTEVPANATLLLSTTEIDLAAFHRGEGWGDAAQKSVPVVIGRVAVEPPPVPPTDDAHYQHSLATIHFGAGDAYNRTENPLFLDIQRAVAAAKEGKVFFWPQRP